MKKQIDWGDLEKLDLEKLDKEIQEAKLELNCGVMLLYIGLFVKEYLDLRKGDLNGKSVIGKC